MSTVVVAYVPVLHEGYRRFIATHATDAPLFVVGPELYDDDRFLAKDIRRLDADLVRSAVASWGLCSDVQVLDEPAAVRLGQEGRTIVLPAEDVSYRLVERFFPRSPVVYDPVFLRWDKSRTAQLLEPAPARVTSEVGALAELIRVAESEAARSIDWWRQVGAAMRLATGEVLSASNEHGPHPLSAYVAGDPRTNFSQGVHIELSTAAHAEARLIAEAARRGTSTEAAELFVTDFPCPPCARLVAGAGVARLFYRKGYAMLDGQEILQQAGVEIVRVDDPDLR